jgi:hypothetical protein
MNRLSKIIIVICGAVFLSGCAHHYTGHHSFTTVTPGYVSVSAPVVSLHGTYRVYDPVVYYSNRWYNHPHHHRKRSYYSPRYKRHHHRAEPRHSDRRGWRDRRRH